MWRAALTIALVLAGGIAGSAWGSFAEVGRSCQKTGCTDHTRYTADPGERNDIRVTGDGRSTTFHDAGATVRGGPGCTVADEHTVTCRRTEFGETYPPPVDAGDGDDRLEDAGAVGAYLDGGLGDDLILGSTESQYLYGGGGIDRIEGRGGHDNFVDHDVMTWMKYDNPDSDTMVGSEDGSDTVDYQHRSRALTIDLAAGVGGEPGERDRLISIENIAVSGGDSVLAGDDGPNRIFSGGGDARIFGRGGNDSISTGPGAERVSAGPGDDVVEVGFHLETPGDDDPDRVSCGPGADRLFFVEPGDLIGEDCESIGLVETVDGGFDMAAVGLRLPLRASREAFVIVPRSQQCSGSAGRIATVRVTDGRAPAKGLLGRAAARCSKRSRAIRQLRLALSPAGASYLERVGRARVRIGLETRSGRQTQRGGFTTTLRSPGAASPGS